MLKHPIPCSARDLAGVLELSERRVSELTRVQVFTKPYELTRDVRAYCRFLRQDVGGLRDARVRVAKLRGDLLQLEFQTRTGELVPQREVDNDFFRLGNQAKEGLANIPFRVSSIVQAEAVTAVMTALSTMPDLSPEHVAVIRAQLERSFNQHTVFTVIEGEISQALEHLVAAHAEEEEHAQTTQGSATT